MGLIGFPGLKWFAGIKWYRNGEGGIIQGLQGWNRTKFAWGEMLHGLREWNGTGFAWSKIVQGLRGVEWYRACVE